MKKQMALRKMGMTMVIMLIVSIFWAGVSAQPSCPGALTSLTPCLSISIRNSSTPSSSCCSELANMLQTAPVCLCNVLNGVGGELLGGFLNRTLASALPSACNMQTPPISECDGLGSPGMGDTGYSEGSMLKIPLMLAIFFTLVASYTLHF